MKKFKVVFVFATLFLLTFAGSPSTGSSLQRTSQNPIVQNALGIIIVEFSFNYNGCSFTVLATINSTTGNGYGTLTGNCGGNKREIVFSIYGATVVRGTEPYHLINFKEDSQDIDIDATLKSEIANGINENWPDEETED